MPKIKVFINSDLPHLAGSGGIVPEIKVFINRDLTQPAGKRDFVFEAFVGNSVTGAECSRVVPA